MKRQFIGGGRISGFAVFLIVSFGGLVHAQLSANVAVDVTENDGLYTYEYTVANSVLSSLSVNWFQLDVGGGDGVVVGEDVEFGVRSLNAPDNWVGEYQPYEVILDDDFVATGIRINPTTNEPEPNRTEEVSYLAGDGLTCPVDASADVFSGDTKTFTLQSEYSPGEGSFVLAKLDSACGFVGSTAGIVDVPLIPPVSTGLECDFDGDGTCDLVDIDQLGTEIAAGTHSAAFDLTSDGLVDGADLGAFLDDDNVQRINGDADFNGGVEFGDFLVLANNFNASGISWSGGDFVPNGVVEFDDFLVVSANFGKSFEGAQTASVPEPSCLALAMSALVPCLASRRRRR